MSEESGFRSMGQLVSALRDAEQGLRTGSLDMTGLDAACNDARELYERLVVLRHKAREGKGKEPQAPPAPPPPAPVVAPPPQEPATASAIKLDTRPADTRQTSLIEAIENSEKTDPVVPETTGTPSGTKPPPTLAEKMEKAHIDDIGKAISVSHKFWFTAELFNGDRTGFDKAIDHLNSTTDLASALSWFENEVIARAKKPADPEAKATFVELLKRRFA